MDFSLKHAALSGALGGLLVSAIVAITEASVGVMYLLSVVTIVLIMLTVGLIGDPEQREARRRARRPKAVQRQR